MTNNEKLARWQGWKNDTTLGWCKPIGNSGSWFAEVEVPDYLNDDAAAMSLLDTLVEKGYCYEMGYQKGDSYPCWIRLDVFYIYISRQTRREAVITAVLELIGKEVQHDQTTEA